MLPGVYSASKKNQEFYYRASVTYMGKHISLGSFKTENDAHAAYMLAREVLYNSDKWSIEKYPENCLLTFGKWVSLVNVRDNGIYFKNPIYLKKRYFLYYIDRDLVLKFDVDDLFYYARHKILRRGGRLFTSEYGMQTSIFTRYGIKNYAVPGKDFRFINGDSTDFRYSNIEIINRYHGVSKHFKKNIPVYLAKININGYYIIGRYTTEEEAAIAYNKAVNILRDKGLSKNFPQNYIDGLDEITYAAIYQRIRISRKILEFELENKHETGKQ